MHVVALSVALSLSACKHPVEPEPVVAAPAPAPVGPFAAPSALPYHFPAFDGITFADFRPAFDAGMAEQRAEIDAIAQNAEPPTFDNTIVALERSGQALLRVSKVFDTLVGSNNDQEILNLQEELAPLRSAHADAILLNGGLFARIDAVAKQRDTLGLDPESLQVLDRTVKRFEIAGARLSDADKQRLAAINTELSTLGSAFDLHVLNATRDAAVVLDDEKMLDGLSAEEKGAAAAAAAERGLQGKWVLTLRNTTVQPVIASLRDRSVREKVYRASIGRGTTGESDNREIVVRTMKLRAEKATLLGYPTYAAWGLAEETAGTPAAVNDMLALIGPAALQRAKEEAAEIQAVIDREAKKNRTAKFELAPWDWDYYAEQVRKEKYAFDESQVRPYFELHHVVEDGIFYAAHELYGLTFEERHDLPVYRPDIRVWEVKDADGTPFALFLLDAYARDNKDGGAWMDTLVDQSTLLDQLPVVTNNLNVVAPAEGQPTLLTYDDVETAFHEFGHALHGLLSRAKYPLLSGTNTPPDFAEFPSQFNEMWAVEPTVLAHYARHYETGEPMPQDLLDKVLAARRFNQGYDTLEYLEAAAIDQAWHQLTADQVPAADGIDAFEQAALEKAGMKFDKVPPRYHTTYFSHMFNGDYAGGYYAYIWSEVLARDSGAWFHAHGGLTRANGDVFRAAILSRGRTAEPAALFSAFYGGPPDPGPLFEYRGLTAPKKN